MSVPHTRVFFGLSKLSFLKSYFLNIWLHNISERRNISSSVLGSIWRARASSVVPWLPFPGYQVHFFCREITLNLSTEPQGRLVFMTPK